MPFLRYRGHSLNSTDPAELAQAKADSIAAKKQLKAYISAPVKAQLISGDVWISQLWNGDTTQAKAEQPNLALRHSQGRLHHLGRLDVHPQERAQQAGRARVDELHPPARGGRGPVRGHRLWHPQRRGGQGHEEHRCPIPPKTSSSGWSIRWIWARTRRHGIRSGRKSSQPDGKEGRGRLPSSPVLPRPYKGAPINCGYRTTRSCSTPGGISISSPGAS